MDEIKKLPITANKINLSNTLTQIRYTKFNDIARLTYAKRTKQTSAEMKRVLANVCCQCSLSESIAVSRLVKFRLLNE